MSEERFGNRLEVSDDEVQAAPPAPKPQPKPKAEEPPPAAERDEDGTDWVDIDDPKLKARFNRLYRHTKEANERAEKTERQIALLAEQNRKLQTALEGVVGGIKDKAVKEEVATLKREAKEALATGDTDAFMDVNERLLEIKQEIKPKPEPQAPAQEAVTPTERQVLQSWQSQQDDDGQPLRPWAMPGHPEFAATQDMVRRVIAEPGMDDAPIREVLREVDRRMRRVLDTDNEPDERPNPVRRAFASPRGATPAPREQTSLSAQEKVIAEAMFMSGRGGLAKNPKEAHELYLKQKRAIGRSVSAEE